MGETLKVRYLFIVWGETLTAEIIEAVGHSVGHCLSVGLWAEEEEVGGETCELLVFSHINNTLIYSICSY